MLYAKIEVRPGKFVSVFNLHPQATNLDCPPEGTAVARLVRDLSFKELVKFVQLKVEQKSVNDLVLISGDFNVFRYPVVEDVA